MQFDSMQNSEIRVLKDLVSAAERSFSRIEGKKTSLRQRDAALVKSVSSAKKLLAMRPEVESVLEQLQRMAHERRVGRYEKLLTALVGDVLPQDINIGLDLYTDRNNTCLDIYVDKGDGNREDIMDGCGGSLDNIVSTGLRLIAMAQMKKRQVLILDEPDCWIKPQRIPGYMNVLTKISQELGVQIFMVSHHSLDFFGEAAKEVAVHNLTGLPDTGLSVVTNQSPRQWEEGQKGLKSIRLANFRSHKDSVLNLYPGVNILIGDNNIGKSQFTAGFRAALYGDCEDGAIRHGCKSLTVEIEYDDRKMGFERRRKGSPKNVWKSYGADGHEIKEKEATGAVPPEWVGNELGVNETNGMQIHVMRQKKPTFVLDNRPQERANILSVGTEADYIPDMFGKQKAKVQDANSRSREGERELSSIREELSRLNATEGMHDRIEQAKIMLSELESSISESASLERVVDEISTLALSVEKVSRRLHILNKLPNSTPEISDINNIEDAACNIELLYAKKLSLLKVSEVLNKIPDIPSLDKTEGILDVGKVIMTLSKRKAKLFSTLECLAKLPEVPEIQDVSSIGKTIDEIVSLRSLESSLRKKHVAFVHLPDSLPVLEDVSSAQKIEEKIQQLAEEKRIKTLQMEDIESAIKEIDIGEECPLCGVAALNSRHPVMECGHAA